MRWRLIGKSFLWSLPLLLLASILESALGITNPLLTGLIAGVIGWNMYSYVLMKENNEQ